MNDLQADVVSVPRHDSSERHAERVRGNGAFFAHAAQFTRMPISIHPLEGASGSITHHFLHLLDIARRFDAERALRELSAELDARGEAGAAELACANARLEDLVHDREQLLVEVNRHVGNSLAGAALILDNPGKPRSDASTDVLLVQARDRLVAMARVHALSNKSDIGLRVDLAVYIDDLCAALQHVLKKDDRIRLETRAETGIVVDAEIAVPLGIVLTELITNAFKHAFPLPRSGTILVQARYGEGGKVEVAIQDDGVGIAKARKSSLGFGIVKRLVRRIGGEIEVEGDAGVTATITFPAARTVASPSYEPAFDPAPQDMRLHIM